MPFLPQLSTSLSLSLGMTPPCSIACNANQNNELPSQNHDESSQLSSSSISLSSSLPSLNFRNQLPTGSLHQCITTLKGHSSYVSALTLHRNFLYSGSSDQDIRLWTSITSDPPSHQITPPSFVVAATKSPVKSLVFSGDNLFSSHQDHKIRVWKINHKENHHRYKLRAVLPTPKDRVLSHLLPKNYVQVRRHKKCTWVHHVDVISGLALSHDGSLLYSVSWDRTLKVWRMSDFKCMESIAGAHHDAINAIAVSRDGYIYTGSADTTIKVWQRRAEDRKHSLVAALKRHESAVNALALSADGSILYSGACDRSVVVWEGAGGLMSATGALRGHTRAILSLAATANFVCSGSADRTVRVWRREGDKRYSCLAALEGHGGPIKSLAIMRTDGHTESSCWSDGTYLVMSGGMDCDIKVWKLMVPNNKQVFSFEL